MKNILNGLIVFLPAFTFISCGSKDYTSATLTNPSSLSAGAAADASNKSSPDAGSSSGNIDKGSHPSCEVKPAVALLGDSKHEHESSSEKHDSDCEHEDDDQEHKDDKEHEDDHD